MPRLTTLQVEDLCLEILGQSVMHGEFMANAYRATRQDGSIFYGSFKTPSPTTVQELDVHFDSYEELREWWNTLQAYNNYYTLPGEEGKGYLPVSEPV